MGRHWRIINENRRERQTSTFNKAKIIKIRIRNFENGKVEDASQVPVETLRCIPTTRFTKRHKEN